MQQLFNLIRICALCVILSIGYAINFKSIGQSLVNGELPVEIWSITYVASSFWLFIWCLIMIIMTLFGIKITALSSRLYKFLISVSFFVGACGYIACLLLGLLHENDNLDNYISWHMELLYILVPIYLACLIYFFNNTRFSHIIKLILTSIILLVTPLANLVLVTLNNNKNGLPWHSNFLTLSAYLSICTATTVLILVHIICIWRHYNSGLFLKFCIISCLAYGITISIIKQIDYDVYEDAYRVYYHYALLCSLYLIYSFEIFIPGDKKVIQFDASGIGAAKSVAFSSRDILVSPGKNIDAIKGILQGCQLCQKKEKLSIKRHRDSFSSDTASYKGVSNPNENIESVVKIFPDFKPCKENVDKYFDEFKMNNRYINNKNGKGGEKIDRVTDSIAAIVPFYNETASQIHATLKALYENFRFIKKKNKKYEFTYFNVLLVGDGWFKADISTKRYLTKLYNIKLDENDNFNFVNYQKDEKHNTVILQTKYNKPLCINPFKNNEIKLNLKVTTVIKIDNRKKANSHEWFLGKYGFAEWCQCDYMFFTDAYSTMNQEALYRMIQHMQEPKNQDVVCCTGRARVYTIEQELDFQNLLREHKYSDSDQKYDDIKEEKEAVYKWWQHDIFKADDEKTIDILDDDGDAGEEVFFNIQDTEYDHRLTTNAHLRSCQMFEFEALYGTIGSYLLGGFLPVIPGPCGFYRSKYLLADEVRGWYFDKINQKNDPLDMDLVLGNMKLAEDRILTISSILNSDESVRHSLITECIFYFDPIPNLTQLMKQRRRWLNGSIATVIFILRKISFSKWNVNTFRTYYVLSMWYMQLLMYFVTAFSPPLLFIIAFKYGLATILDLILIDHGNKTRDINTITTIFLVISWIMFLIFIYFMQRGKDLKICCFTIKKEAVVQCQLVWSFAYGLLILIGTLIQLVQIISPSKIVNDSDNIVTGWFNMIVIIIEILFFVQSFILAPLVSKDFKTFTILWNTFFEYWMYSPFYVQFFFINAIANVHDLSWGTRPDNEAENDNNPKQTTTKILLIVIFIDIVIAIAVTPLTEYVYAYIAFFAVLAFPSLYQIFFSLVWLTITRFNDLWITCKPKKIKDHIEYVGL